MGDTDKRGRWQNFWETVGRVLLAILCVLPLLVVVFAIDHWGIIASASTSAEKIDLVAWPTVVLRAVVLSVAIAATAVVAVAAFRRDW